MLLRQRSVRDFAGDVELHIKLESYSTTRIDAFFHDVKLGSGTGFVYKFADSFSLITNWHVVTGINPISLNSLDGARGYAPNRIEFHVVLKTLENVLPDKTTVHRVYFKPMAIDLYQDQKTVWWESSRKDFVVDIALIPLEDHVPELLEEKTDMFALPGGQMAMVGDEIEYAYVINILPEVAEEVFILGYPEGQSFQGVLPVWKRGTIASEPLFGVEQNGVKNDGILFIDAATNRGMSGAPVLYFGDNLWTLEGQRLSAPSSQKPLLVGVYAGRDGVTSPEDKMGLGRVWKTPYLEALYFDSNRQPGGTFLKSLGTK